MGVNDVQHLGGHDGLGSQSSEDDCTNTLILLLVQIVLVQFVAVLYWSTYVLAPYRRVRYVEKLPPRDLQRLSQQGFKFRCS